MSTANYHVWKQPEIIKRFLSGTRLAFPGAVQQIELMLRLIRMNPKKVGSVLDLGCGDGILGAAVLTQYPQAKGVFLDLSTEMLKSARKNLQSLPNQVAFIEADYGDSGWINHVAQFSPFDTIVSGYSIHHQPDERKAEVYHEIYDLLSPGGIFLNVEHIASPSPWTEHIHNETFIDAIYEFKIKNGSSETRENISNDYYQRTDKDANILATVEAQCECLRRIGFTDVDCYFKLFELSLFGGRKSS